MHDIATDFMLIKSLVASACLFPPPLSPLSTWDMQNNYWQSWFSLLLLVTIGNDIGPPPLPLFNFEQENEGEVELESEVGLGEVELESDDCSLNEDEFSGSYMIIIHVDINLE